MWLNQVESIAVSSTAKQLMLDPGRNGSFGPCPGCGAEFRGSTDKRGPIGIRRDDRGWKCHKCGFGGSGVDLVSFKIFGRKFKELDKESRVNIREWYEERSILTTERHSVPKVTSKVRPPQKEVQLLWKSSLKLNQLPPDDPIISFLLGRNLNLEAFARSGIARVTPQKKNYDWPEWWPGGRSMKWGLIVPAFDAKGRFCSIHARATKETDGMPKTLWPKGYEAGGLFMPNRHAVKMLRGESEIDGLLFVEGITDFIKASTEVEREGMCLAVLGGTSGSFCKIKDLAIPDKAKIYIGTDPDEKGEEYARTIRTQLGSRTAYRLPLYVDGGDGARP